VTAFQSERGWNMVPVTAFQSERGWNMVPVTAFQSERFLVPVIRREIGRRGQKYRQA